MSRCMIRKQLKEKFWLLSVNKNWPNLFDHYLQKDYFRKKILSNKILLP